MVGWSTLRPLLSNAVARNALKQLSVRKMGDHHNFPLQPSRWQWNKFKDLFHLYVFVGAIPVGLLTLYANVFIGPATLTEIPEGYTPKHWEYYPHPITRWIARYLHTSPQQEYEKLLHYAYEEDLKRRMRIVANMVQDKMAERNDYQAYYYRPITAKYMRRTREAKELSDEISGE